ncbi:MAG: radical SAM protein [Nitrospirae bacterium]|nr:radical SAM protein [Nitrospirota bacterium]
MYSPFRHINAVFSKNHPIHLTFFITRKCNSACPFCFYLRTADTRQAAESELTIEEIRKISLSFGELLWLAFSGGEIYLRDDLPEISRIFYRNNRPAIMLFPTNGLLPGRIREMTEQILVDCPKSTIAVKLSMDGLHDAHDRIRNTPGSFANTMETYAQLSELLASYPHFELGVNTVFSAENQDQMDGIIDFVGGLENIKTHTISLVRGNLSNKGFAEIDPAKYLHAIERLEENLKTRGAARTYRFRGSRIKAAQDVIQRRLISQTLAEQKRVIPCYAGHLNLVLTESGEVYPCEILNRGLGNIRDYGYNIQKLLTSDRAKAVLNSIRDNQCYCTHECYFMTNILFTPRLYPVLAREYLQIK